MNAKETIKALSNKKVYVKGMGATVVNLISRLNGEMIDSDSYKKYPFFYITRDGEKLKINVGQDMEIFYSTAAEEITMDQIITMERSLFKFSPFDKVLVRDYHTQVWHTDFFSHVDEFTTQFECVGGKWNQCIPYEGNKNKLGKTE